MTGSAGVHRNEVLVVGRLTSPPEERTLPSGDVIVCWRVTASRQPGGQGYDTIECTAWSARARRAVRTWKRDDVVEVEGSLRRRFWVGPAGSRVSGYAIEVARARRVAAGIIRPRRPG